MLHQYRLNGRNIVLDANSGAVHVVDGLAYDVIGLFEEHSEAEIVSALGDKYPESEVRECVGEVAQLKEAGRLFAPDTFAPIAGELKARTAGVVKALCLHVAHTCNLNCSYCFASQGRYHGERALMSFETGRKALDFLVAHSGSRRHLEVDFCGGEPLMNFDVVKQLVAYARSIEQAAGKRFRFTLTTNGMNIDDDVIDFCNRECHNVVLSLDGRKEIHDFARVDYQGRGSFDRVVPKFQRLVEKRGGKNYYMRGTFTHRNPDFLEDIRTMLDLGFTELSMEPVVCAPDDPAALTPEDLEIVKRQYEELAVLMDERRREGRPFTFYHYMIDLTGGPCIYKRVSGCGSGTEYLAVTPTGELYPCHQFVGEERFRLGSLDEGLVKPEVQAEFANTNVYTREECRSCWARLWCAGGCAANAWHATGSINGVYKAGCELFRKRMECAIWLEATRLSDGQGA